MSAGGAAVRGDCAGEDESAAASAPTPAPAPAADEELAVAGAERLRLSGDDRCW